MSVVDDWDAAIEAWQRGGHIDKLEAEIERLRKENEQLRGLLAMTTARAERAEADLADAVELIWKAYNGPAQATAWARATRAFLRRERKLP